MSSSENTPDTHDVMSSVNDIPILLRRRIEAMMLKHVLDVVTERSDKSEAEAVIGEACSRSAIEQGKQMAAALDSAPDLQDFAAILPNWTREDALRIETIETSNDKMDFNVTRCRYAEMYKEMGWVISGIYFRVIATGTSALGITPI